MDKDVIKKIAKLCKLRFSDSELEIFEQEFKKILDWMQSLEKVNVDGIEPYMTPVTGNLRKDEINAENILDKKTALELAYSHDENYITVPSVAVKH